jgi:hypothetical protein
MKYNKLSQCTLEERDNYLTDYLSTIDALEEALAMFQIMAVNATTEVEKSDYRIKALEMQRKEELVKSKRRAFQAESSAIAPPSPAVVAKTALLAEKLAKIQVEQANAEVILSLATKVFDSFNKLHNPA